MISGVTVCILTKNSAATLAAALDSVRFFSEILIYDNGSQDETLAIAARYPHAVIHQGPFIGFGSLRNKAASLAQNDWILALDSDEVISPPLLEELTFLSLDPTRLYSFPRHNFYNGKKINGCGWGKDRVIRLYHRQATSYSTADVHESVLKKDLRIIQLQAPLLHTPFRSTAEFLAKMQHYSTLFAKQNQGKKKSPFVRAIGSALFTFMKSYLFQKGLFLGKEGFIISLYNANTAFYKYLKIWEL